MSSWIYRSVTLVFCALKEQSSTDPEFLKAFQKLCMKVRNYGSTGKIPKKHTLHYEML